MMKRSHWLPSALLVAASILFVSVSWLQAFSPYENFLLSGEDQRVGLMATIDPERVEEAKKVVRQASPHLQKDGEKHGLRNLNLFVRKLGERSVVFVYFEAGGIPLDELAKQPAKVYGMKALEALLTPHARAKDEAVWVRMEVINCIATTKVFPYEKTKVRHMGLMSGLRPDKEVAYRRLHQTNWPGVVDGMVESNYRDWTTFLIEEGEKLYLFTYCQYIGDDIDADNKVMAADPTTQRWWKQTEPCLINLHGEGNWSLMAPLAE